MALRPANPVRPPGAPAPEGADPSSISQRALRGNNIDNLVEIARREDGVSATELKQILRSSENEDGFTPAQRAQLWVRLAGQPATSKLDIPQGASTTPNGTTLGSGELRVMNGLPVRANGEAVVRSTPGILLGGPDIEIPLPVMAMPAGAEARQLRFTLERSRLPDGTFVHQGSGTMRVLYQGDRAIGVLEGSIALNKGAIVVERPEGDEPLPLSGHRGTPGELLAGGVFIKDGQVVGFTSSSRATIDGITLTTGDGDLVRYNFSPPAAYRLGAGTTVSEVSRQDACITGSNIRLELGDANIEVESGGVIVREGRVTPIPESVVTTEAATPVVTELSAAPTPDATAPDERWNHASFEAAAQALREDGMVLAHMPAWLRANQEAVRTAVMQNPGALRFADASLRNNRNFVSNLIWSQPSVLEHMPAAWRTDVTFALTVVGNNPAAAAHFAPELWADPDVARAVLATLTRRGHEHYEDDEMRYEQPDRWLERKRAGVGFLEHLPASFRDDPTSMLPLVRQNGLALQFASPRLRADPDIVRAAVQNVGLALEFADPALQRDVAIADAAVRNWGGALRFVPAGTRLDRQAYLQALRNQRTDELFDRIPADLANDPDFARDAVRANGLWLTRCPERASDLEWARDAVSSRPAAIRLVAKELRGDAELAQRLFNHHREQRRSAWLAYVEGAALEDPNVLRNAFYANPENLAYLPAAITGDRDQALALLRTSVPIYPVLDEALRRDPEIVRAAIGTNAQGVLEHLPHDTPDYVELAREALERDPAGFAFVTAELKADRALAARLASRDGRVLAHVPTELFSDEEFLAALNLESQSHTLRSIPIDVPGYAALVERVLARDPNALQWLPGPMITRELLDRALAHGPHAIQFAPMRFRNNPDIMVPLLEQQPHLFQYAGPRLAGDRELVLRVVAKSGEMLRFVAPALRGDDAVIRAALAQDGMAVRHAEPAWLAQQSYEQLAGWINTALANDPSLVVRLPARMRDRPEITALLLERGGDALAYIDPATIDFETAMGIVEQRPNDYQRLSRSLQERPELARKAVENNGWMLQSIPMALRADPELVRLALANNPGALQFADESLRSDPEFVREFLERDPNAYRNLAGRARRDPALLRMAMKDQPHVFRSAEESLRASPELARWAVSRDGTLLQYVPAPTNARRDVVLAALRQNGYALQHAPEAMKNDPAVVDIAMAQNPGAFRWASETLRANPARARAAVTGDPELFRELTVLHDDAATVMTIACQRPHLLQFASASLRDRDDIVREAVLRNGNAFQWASPRLQNDEQLALDALSTDTNAAQWASARLKADREFALAAVAIAPDSLRHLRGFANDKEVVLAAVYTSGQSLEHASAGLRADPEVVVAAVMQHADAARHAPELAGDKRVVIATLLQKSGSDQPVAIPAALANDIDVCLAAVYANAGAFATLPPEQQADRRIVLAAVRRHGQIFSTLPEPLKRDPQILRTAIAANGMLLEHAPAELKNDPALVAIAVSNAPLALQFAHPDRRADRALVRLAVERDGDAIQYAAAALRDDPVLARIALVENPASFKHLGALKRDRAFILSAVRHSAQVVAELPAMFRRDPSFMIAAVQANGKALSRAMPPASTDRQVVINAVAQDGEAYPSAGMFMQDAEIARIAMARGGRLSQLPEELRWRPELVRAALTWDPRNALTDLPAVEVDGAILAEAIAQDPTVVNLLRGRPDLVDAWRSLPAEQARPLALQAVNRDGILLEHLDGFKDDPEVVLAAVSESGEALRFVDESLRADRAIVLAAVKRNRAGIDYAQEKGSNNVGGPTPILDLAAPEFRRDKEIVLAAVRANAHNFTQAHPSLKADRDVVKAAVEQDGIALQWVTSPELLDDEEIARIAVASSGRAYTHLSARLKANRDIALTALNTGVSGHAGYGANPGYNALLSRVPWQLRSDPELIRAAIRSNENNYAAAPLAARLDLDNAVLAAANGWHQFVGRNYRSGQPVTQINPLLAMIPAPLRRDAASMLELLEHDRSAMPAASWEVLTDPEFQAQAVRNNPLLLLTTSRTRDNKVLSFSTPIDLDAVQSAHPELRAEADRLMGHLARFGIDYTGRMGTGPMVKSVVDNRLALERGDRAADKPMVLVVYPAADHNAALHSPRVSKLASAYDVLYFEVQTEGELIDALESSAAHRAADFVLLAGHGNGWALRLDELATDDGEVQEHHTLDLTDREQLVKPAIARAVVPGANVMIISCSNARGRDTRYNLAHLYAEMFPSAWIHAAVFPTNARIQLKEDGTFLRSHYLQGHRMAHTIPPVGLAHRPTPED